MKFGTDLSPAVIYNAANLKWNCICCSRSVGLFQCPRQLVLKENKPMNLRRMLLVVMVLAVVAVGQSFRGGILGTLTDASGASVADAKVTAINTGTGLARESTTDADGNYNFTELPLGTYSITATKQGFRTKTATNIQVGVEGPQRASLTLTPGRVEEKVEVQADVPLVETSSNTLGGTLQAEDFKDLPVNG